MGKIKSIFTALSTSLCIFSSAVLLGLQAQANSLETLPQLPSRVYDEKGWEKSTSRDGFILYIRQNTNSGILELKVEGELAAPLPQVMANLRDVESSVKWTPDLMEKVTLRDVSDLEADTYSLTNLPWPFYDRHMVLNNKLFIDPERKLLVVYSHSISPGQKKIKGGTVEALMQYGYVAMRPTTAQRTYVKMIALIDPQGSIPAWVVNFFQRKWPINFFKALESYCQRAAPIPLRPHLKKMMQELLKRMNWPLDAFEPPGRGGRTRASRAQTGASRK